MEDPNPKGTIVFTTVGRPYYGFDIFSVSLPSSYIHHHLYTPSERCLTDSISINYNGQFVDEDQTLVYVSERTGSAQIYLNQPGTNIANHLPCAPESLFHDRPIFKNGQIYFVSAHQQPHQPFKSWSAIYTKPIIHHHHHRDDDYDESITLRLTPYGSVDYSPSISQSGKYIAVASYGSRPWGGEFHDLLTDIVIFRPSQPTTRAVVCEHGGWPTWSGDSTIFFHRQADDGWWSIFRIDLPHRHHFSQVVSYAPPQRVTPPGLHCFTPAVINLGKQLAVATRRPDTNYRHIEIFDVESQNFYPVTKLLNPTSHHYNPFVSPESGFLGYHRFRGESAAVDGESNNIIIIPQLDPVSSPIKGLRMLRLNGSFPSFTPAGDMLAFNHDFDSNSGLKIVRSDGSKRWSLIEYRTAFYNSWSPSERHVIYTSIGPIFESVKATVQIARVSFDPANLDNDDKDEEEDIITTVNVKILTRDDTGNNAFPACSPDGKSLVFRSGRSGHKNLYIMDAVNGEFEDDGGCIRQLTDGPWIDTMPAWSPDGKLIAFSSNRHNPDNVDAFSIYVISPDGKDLRRIHVAGSGDENRERINHVCFSADGQWLLFTANIGGVTAEPVSMPNQFQPYGDLHIARLDGSGLRRLTWNGYENGTPAWHPRDEIEMELAEGVVGDKLKAQFDEPLWIHCDL